MKNLESRQVVGIGAMISIIFLTLIWLVLGSPSPQWPSAPSEKIELRIPVDKRPLLVRKMSQFLQNDFRNKRLLPANAQIYRLQKNIVIVCTDNQCSAAQKYRPSVLFTSGSESLEKIKQAVKERFDD